jgi:ABC-type uncharacterized transport system substrate-binding protein
MPTTRSRQVLPAKWQTGNGKLLFLALALLIAWGCSPAPSKPIVIFCSPDSPRMQQAIAALRQGLPDAPVEVICVPEFGPEIKENLQRLRRLKPRLLVVLGTPAFIQAAPAEKHFPVVFALVADPYFTGAAPSREHPEDHQENLTGLASPMPLEAALKQGAGLIGNAAWGLLSDPDDGGAAALAAEFTQKAPQFGLTPLVESSRGAATDPQAVKRLLSRGARVIYLPPAASTARFAPLVLDQGRQLKFMVVSGYPEGSHQGALLWVALDYRRLGEQTAALAQRILQGEAPRNIPIAQALPLKIELDEKLLRHWSGYPGNVRQ